MSEAMAAPSGAPAASAGTATTTNAQAGQTQATTKASSEKAGKAGPETAQATQAAPAEDLEEIKIGSATARVPKEFAKTIKALEKGFHTKAQEAAAGRQLFQLAEQAKTNPAAADMLMERFGIDADQYSQARLAKRLQMEMMSPEQRRLQELESYKAQKDKEEQETKAKAEQEQMTRAEQKADQDLRSGLFSALQKSSLPAEGMTPAELSYAAAKAASYMARSESSGLGWTWEQCVAKVEQEQEHSTRHWVSKLDPETLEKKLGREALDKWREYDVRRVTGASAPKASSSSRPARSAASTQEAPKKMLSEAEYREWFKTRSKNG